MSRIRLTEGQLRRVIKESVRRILREEEIEMEEKSFDVVITPHFINYVSVPKQAGGFERDGRYYAKDGDVETTDSVVFQAQTSNPEQAVKQATDEFIMDYRDMVLVKQTINKLGTCISKFESYRKGCEDYVEVIVEAEIDEEKEEKSSDFKWSQTSW